MKKNYINNNLYNFHLKSKSALTLPTNYSTPLFL